MADPGFRFGGARSSAEGQEHQHKHPSLKHTVKQRTGKFRLLVLLIIQQVKMQNKRISYCRETVRQLHMFLSRDASAERGNATVSRPSVTFRYQQHIGWNSSKIISRPNSLRPLL